MTLEQEKCEKLLNSIFELRQPAIDVNRRASIEQFLKTTINGDTVQSELIINATFDKDKSGVIVYILTNSRLLKIQIDGNSESISSVGPYLETIKGIDRKVEKDRITVSVLFPDTTVGLSYDLANVEINSFFQKVDAVKIQKAGGNS